MNGIDSSVVVERLEHLDLLSECVRQEVVHLQKLVAWQNQPSLPGLGSAESARELDRQWDTPAPGAESASAGSADAADAAAAQREYADAIGVALRAVRRYDRLTAVAAIEMLAEALGVDTGELDQVTDGPQ